MLTVSFPDRCHAEHRWISSVLLGEHLGLRHEVRFDGGNIARISAGGRTLLLPDLFFAAAHDRWLADDTLPAEPLRKWTVAESGLHADIAVPSVPVIYGTGRFDMHAGGDAALGLDVFGSAFFMLSRYEEAVSRQRDSHDRFPASASLAWRAGFLERPIVDEYAEILWAAMSRLWPQLERRQRSPRMLVSCDVDQPYHPGAVSFSRFLKRSVGETLRGHSLSGAIGPLRNFIAGRKGDWRYDPYYYTVDWIMDVNESAGNTVLFCFIPEVTDARMDDTCEITEPAVRAMMKRIAGRGHEIGLHPGYHAYRDRERIFSCLKRLQTVLDQEGIAQPVRGGRHHYLRWSTATPASWDAAGLVYDSTLGYADRAGFRCGTCREYAMFDLHARKPLGLKQRPLICMEKTVITYMGHGLTGATTATMNRLKETTRRFRGDFTLLWHNSALETPEARNIYREVIA